MWLKNPEPSRGEPLANATLRMVHAREAARALYVLADLTGDIPDEAKALSGNLSVAATAMRIQGRKNLF